MKAGAVTIWMNVWVPRVAAFAASGKQSAVAGIASATASAMTLAFIAPSDKRHWP